MFPLIIGLNITLDSIYTRVPLAEKLFENSLTMVGTVHHKNPHVPPIMKPSKSRALHTSEFGFCGNVSMVSYVSKHKKAEILLSTMLPGKDLNETNAKKEPEVFQYYNRTKGGVSSVLQMAQNYTCKRRTKRWSMLMWYNMLNIAIVNFYTMFIAQHPGFMGGGPNTQRLFMKELVKQLVVPLIVRRRDESHGLSRNILEAMERCGVPTPVTIFTSKIQEQSGQKKIRKRCCFCRALRDRKVSSFCSECGCPVCTTMHSRMVVICQQCIR